MQSIADVLPKGRKSLQQSAQALPVVASQPKQTALPWFDDAFREICLSCSAWRVSLPNGDWAAAAKRVWVGAFADAGLSDRASIQKGIDRLISQGQQYLPSPAEFIALCQPSPEDLGVTSLEAAYKEAIKKAHQRRYGGNVEWSHVVVKFAAGRCLQELLEGREPSVKERFATEYKYAFEQFRKGELEQSQAQLAHQGKDEDAMHYLYVLNNFGTDAANDFLAACAKRGRVINPETGAISVIEISPQTQEERAARFSQFLDEVRAILNEPTASATIARGGM